MESATPLLLPGHTSPTGGTCAVRWPTLALGLPLVPVLALLVSGCGRSSNNSEPPHKKETDTKATSVVVDYANGKLPRVPLHEPFTTDQEMVVHTAAPGNPGVSRSFAYLPQGTSDNSIFLRGDSQPKRALDYFPIRATRKYKFRKRVFARYGSQSKGRDAVTNIAPLLSWRLVRLPPARMYASAEIRVLSAIETGETAVGQRPTVEQTELAVEESIVLGDPRPDPDDTKGNLLFPVTIERGGQAGRDGRYDDELERLWWFVKEREDGLAGVFERAVYRTRVTELDAREARFPYERSMERPLLMNAPSSLVEAYSGGRRVRHGYVARPGEGTVITPAGAFADTVMFIEYLLERDPKAPLNVPRETVEAFVDQGWYTVSWYAKGVGLVAEIQLTLAGGVTYWLELLERPAESM